MNKQAENQNKHNNKTNTDSTKSLVGINQFKPAPPNQSNNNEGKKTENNDK